MKKILLIAVLATTYLLNAQTNLIQNGALEDWTTGQLDNWAVQEGTVTEQNANISNGSSSALFVYGPTAPRIVSSDYTLEAGKSYQLSFDYQVTLAAIPLGTQQVISFSYSATDGDPINNTSTIPPDTNWNTVTRTINPTVTETYNFEISLNSFVADGFQVVIDNIKLVDTSEPTPDRDALEAIYTATNGASWSNPWDLAADHTTWDGVQINSEGRVTGLLLANRGLTGALPAEIGDLSELVRIQIVNNPGLSGTIPAEIGNLANLQILELSSNGFSGAIPDQIDQLQALRELILSGNGFTSLPATITGLGNLEILNIANNSFTGNLPAALGSMSALTTLNIDNNDFDGSIPTSIGSLSNLEVFSALANSFSGNIPTQLGSLLSLENLTLTANQLSGSIPTTFSGLANLQFLRLANNGSLSGDIPSGIWGLTNLEEINLENTDVSGSIAPSINALTNLKILNLRNTNLTGAIPTSLWTITSLETINLDNITTLDPWTLPSSISSLVNLRFFQVGNSNLSGDLPDSFGAMADLQRFQVENNDLSGELPASLSALTNLQLISFQNTNLSGTLPAINATGVGSFFAFGNQYIFEDIEPVYTNYTTNISSIVFQSQDKIDTEEEPTVFEGNNYTMSVTATSSANNIYQWRKDGVDIPGATNSSYTLTNLTSSDSGVYDCVITNSVVSFLSLERNTITINVFSESQKDALIAIYNATDGPNWTNPWDLTLEMDQWAGVILNSFNQVEELQLSNRNLTGVLPTELGDLANLKNLYISNNNLTGNLPASVSNLSNLEIINASDNPFSGSLPDALGDITTLREIYFLRNNLTGTIPSSYINLINLQILNLLNNDINGMIPSGFSNLSNLRILNIESNTIGGDLSWLAGLSSLENLNIKANNFSGTIPVLSGLGNLTSINLSQNALSGSPVNVFINANYQSIDISSNSFDAYQFPNTIGNYTSLRELNLSNTNLSGTISDVFTNLIELRSLILNNNNLEGALPNSLTNIPSLNRILLSNNDLTGTIPLVPTTNLSILSLDTNKFVFENIEAALGHYRSGGITFDYFGQKNVDTQETISLSEGDNFSITVQATSSINNTYQWRKNGVNISGATNTTYTINSVSATDAGIYDCIINNTIITDLTIGKESITLLVLVSDDDNDGVNDANDLCPNTPEGDIVNADGCSVDQLANVDPNDIQVRVTSASCPNTSNGEVTISFTEDFTYTVTVTGPGENRILEDIGSTQDLVISDLAAGTYGICVTIPNIPGFEQCYSTVIQSPDDLKASKASIDMTQKKVTLSVSGSTYYEVKVNSDFYEFRFNDTASKTLILDLDQSINTIEITTDKICQGKFQDIIVLENAMYSFPNPFANDIFVVGLEKTATAEIAVTDLSGKLVYHAIKNNLHSGELKLSLAQLPAGAYLLHVTTDIQIFNTQIYKK